jgi:septum formation topological specificity factor MinE
MEIIRIIKRKVKHDLQQWTIKYCKQDWLSTKVIEFKRLEITIKKFEDLTGI